MVLLRNLITNEFYIDKGKNIYGEKEYYPLRDDWKWYHRLGLLEDILKDMKVIGLEVPIISNVWEYEYSQQKWEFMPDGIHYDLLVERITIDGEPGTQPSQPQKDEIEQLMVRRYQEMY